MKLKFLTVILLTIFSGSINAQVISGVSPSSGDQGQSITVSISGSGTNFTQATSTSAIRFRQGTNTVINPDSYNIISDTQIDADFSIPNNQKLGLYDVDVYTTSDGNVIGVDGFYVNPDPTSAYIDNVTPSSGNPGQSVVVSISGQNTNFSQATSTQGIWFSQGTSTYYPYNYDVVDNENMAAYFSIPYNANLGLYNVNVNNPVDGTIYKPDGFYLYNTGTFVYGIVKANAVPVPYLPVVLLIKGSDGVYLPVKIQSTDPWGNYVFENVPQSDFIVMAYPTSSISGVDYLPTYSGDTYEWKKATEKYAALGTSNPMGINLIPASILSGNNRVRGSVFEGEEPVRSISPKEDVSVILENIDNGGVVNAVTNEDGEYEFNNVVDGNYSIYVDLPGEEMISTYSFSLANGESVSKKNFVVNETGIKKT